MKIVILGGNAAGMSAAALIKRRYPDVDILVFEKTDEVSFGACGLPYYVAGLNEDLDLIRIRSAQTFIESGIDLRLKHEVVGYDFDKREVRVTADQGQEILETYDKLLIATGASARIPPIPGIGCQNCFVLKTLEDAVALKEAFLAGKDQRLVIVGGGASGLEIAEAALLQGIKNIRIIEATPQLINPYARAFSDLAQKELEKQGVKVHLQEMAKAVTREDQMRIETDKASYEADIIVISIGVVPNTGFIQGLDKLPNGALITDRAMKTNQADVYAAGDCASVWHKVLDKPVYLALGTNANKQGRLAAESMMGKPVDFDRAIGTSMLRIMDLELAKTGLSEAEAQAASLPVKTKTIEAASHARYYPDPGRLTVKLTYSPDDHRILGAQIAGEQGAALRINPLAVAIDQGMTTDQFAYVDLGYAPPFSSVWDAIQIAANVAR